jgi:hypothetical protein
MRQSLPMFTYLQRGADRLLNPDQDLHGESVAVNRDVFNILSNRGIGYGGSAS